MSEVRGVEYPDGHGWVMAGPFMVCYGGGCPYVVDTSRATDVFLTTAEMIAIDHGTPYARSNRLGRHFPYFPTRAWFG